MPGCSCPTAQEIRGEMAAIRSHLDGEVGGIVLNARRLADWRYYVRAFPWISVLGGIAVGYVAIPRRKPKAVSDEASTSAHSAGNGAYIPAQAGQSWGASLGGMAASFLIKTALAYFSEQMKRRFHAESARAQCETASRRVP